MTTEETRDEARDEARELLRIEILDVTLDNLDEVLVRHTSLFDRITTEMPVLRDQISETKDEISRQHALLDQSIRSDAAKAGTKVTENKIEATIQLNEDYLNALAAHRQAKLDLSEDERLRDLMFQREWSIRELIKLYMGEYWGISGIHERRVISDGVAAESVKRQLRAKGKVPNIPDLDVTSNRGKAARSFKRG